MSQNPKKIVSKGEYAKILVSRLTEGGAAILLLCGALTFGLFAVFCGIGHVRNLWLHEMKYVAVTACSLLFCSFIAWIMFQGAVASVNQFKSTRYIVPFTQANLADLPADESLVRASEQPPITQSDILLRSAIETDETSAEQLLRPS